MSQLLRGHLRLEEGGTRSQEKEGSWECFQPRRFRGLLTEGLSEAFVGEMRGRTLFGSKEEGHLLPGVAWCCLGSHFLQGAKRCSRNSHLGLARVTRFRLACLCGFFRLDLRELQSPREPCAVSGRPPAPRPPGPPQEGGPRPSDPAREPSARSQEEPAIKLETVKTYFAGLSRLQNEDFGKWTNHDVVQVSQQFSEVLGTAVLTFIGKVT